MQKGIRQEVFEIKIAALISLLHLRFFRLFAASLLGLLKFQFPGGLTQWTRHNASDMMTAIRRRRRLFLNS